MYYYPRKVTIKGEEVIEVNKLKLIEAEVNLLNIKYDLNIEFIIGEPVKPNLEVVYD